MTRAVLVAWCLAACSGSSPPLNEPQQTSELLTQSRPTPAETHEAPVETHEAPAETHEAPAETHEAPAETHDTPANAQPDQAVDCKAQPPCETFIPPRFWCVESRKTADGPPLNLCYSTEKTCSKLRQDGIDAGVVVTACQPRESAHCFTMVQAIDQKVYWRCYKTGEDCESSRAKWKIEQPKLTFGACRFQGVRSEQTRQ